MGSPMPHPRFSPSQHTSSHPLCFPAGPLSGMTLPSSDMGGINTRNITGTALLRRIPPPEVDVPPAPPSRPQTSSPVAHMTRRRPSPAAGDALARPSWPRAAQKLELLTWRQTLRHESRGGGGYGRVTPLKVAFHPIPFYVLKKVAISDTPTMYISEIQWAVHYATYALHHPHYVRHYAGKRPRLLWWLST